MKKNIKEVISPSALLPQYRVESLFKELQAFLKSATDKSPKAIVKFLKNKGLTQDQIKYFIYKANIKASGMSYDKDWEKQQGNKAAFQQLPRWAQWGLSYFGKNPTDASKLK